MATETYQAVVRSVSSLLSPKTKIRRCRAVNSAAIATVDMLEQRRMLSSVQLHVNFGSFAQEAVRGYLGLIQA
jgi:hypothetical protein